MRIGPHHHPCQVCGKKTKCGGVPEQNYDGWPEWICRGFHLANGDINRDFICHDCNEAALTAASLEESHEQI